VTGKIAGDRNPARKVLAAAEEADQPDGLTTSRPTRMQRPRREENPAEKPEKPAIALRRPPAGEKCPGDDRKSRPNSPALPPPSSATHATRENWKEKRGGERKREPVKRRRRLPKTWEPVAPRLASDDRSNQPTGTGKEEERVRGGITRAGYFKAF